jgi:nucleoside phosphorylase
LSHSISEKYEVQTASNFEEAKKFIQKASFDFLIVGLGSLQVFHEENSVGLEFLDFVEREHSNIPKIIIDADSNNTDTLTKGSFSRDELIEAVENYIAVDFMIITTLREEYNAVLSKFSNVHKIDKSQSVVKVLTTKTFTYRVVIVCLSFLRREIGTVMAAIKTTGWIKDWKPKNVLLVGITDGIRDKTNIGDIIIPKKIIETRIRKKFVESKRQPDYEVYFPSEVLFKKSDLKNWYHYINEERSKPGEPKLHTRGSILSSEDRISDPQLVNSYKKIGDNMYGFEMECGGVAEALKNVESKPEFLMIRAVSDFGDGSKEEDQKKWEKYALDAAASYTRAFLESGPVPPLKKNE